MATRFLRALGALVLASTVALGGAAAQATEPYPIPDGPLGSPGRPLSRAGSTGTHFITDACTRTVLRYGSKGECVTQLQMTLYVLYMENLAFDGNYGPATTSAVYRFQGRYKLSFDGICGPQTWAKLLWAHDRARRGLPY